MKFSKVCNTIAAVVGYATLAVAAYTVADALRITIEDELERKKIKDVLNTPYDKDMTMGEWFNRGGDDINV